MLRTLHHTLLRKLSSNTSGSGGDVMNENDIVDILDPVTGKVIAHCYGPATEGGCPLASQDGTVLCRLFRLNRATRVEGADVGRP